MSHAHNVDDFDDDDDDNDDDDHHNDFRLILSKGADVNSISGQGYTPLHMVSGHPSSSILST